MSPTNIVNADLIHVNDHNGAVGLQQCNGGTVVSSCTYTQKYKMLYITITSNSNICCREQKLVWGTAVLLHRDRHPTCPSQTVRREGTEELWRNKTLKAP